MSFIPITNASLLGFGAVGRLLLDPNRDFFIVLGFFDPLAQPVVFFMQKASHSDRMRCFLRYCKT